MKKTFINAFAKAFTLVAACVTIASFGSSVNGQPTEVQSNTNGNPFGELTELSVGEIDTDEYFGATGIAYGQLTEIGDLQVEALENAKEIVHRKMRHAYKGLISSYSNSVRNNDAANKQSKLESLGNQIIDDMVNDIKATRNPILSDVDDKGNVYYFISVRVNKKELADKIAEYISKDEELSIRLKEDEFRKRMDEAFKEYKEEQK